MRRLFVLYLIAFCLGVTSGFAGVEITTDSGDDVSLRDWLMGVKISGVYFLSYQDGVENDDSYSEFAVRRAYLTARKSILPYLGARITFDAHQDAEGDMEVRLKYAYANFHIPDFAQLTKQRIEFGIVHGPWHDFEQHVNYYRMREKMFIERSGVMNSADFGATYAAYLGGEMDDDYKNRVNKKYAGRYGSLALGVYNGGGYHAVEENLNKVFEGRLTLRPLADMLPGLQLSGFTVYGEGNVAGTDEQIPDFNVILGMVSYEHALGTFTAQYMSGEGNQKGSYTILSDPTRATSYEGYSLFGELKYGQHWRSIAGFDMFDPNVDAHYDDYTRLYAGVGYDFGSRNILLFDYDIVDYNRAGTDNDNRFQLTMQVHF